MTAISVPQSPYLPNNKTVPSNCTEELTRLSTCKTFQIMAGTQKCPINISYCYFLWIHNCTAKKNYPKLGDNVKRWVACLFGVILQPCLIGPPNDLFRKMNLVRLIAYYWLKVSDLVKLLVNLQIFNPHGNANNIYLIEEIAPRFIVNCHIAQEPLAI